MLVDGLIDVEGVGEAHARCEDGPELKLRDAAKTVDAEEGFPVEQGQCWKEEVELEQRLEGALTADLNHLGPAADDGPAEHFLAGLDLLPATGGQIFTYAKLR